MEEKKYDIFISYRRADASGTAGRIYDRLKKEFNIFFDVDAISKGEEFPFRIKKGIEASDILLSIIGTKSCIEFKKRLSDEDFVVEEIAYANILDKGILPILINDATMPSKNCIPTKIDFFVKKNASHIAHEKFDRDIEELINDIKKLIKYKNTVGNIKKQPKKNFNNADSLLETLGGKRKMYFEEVKKKIKYQFWGCGRDVNPDYYLIFFPSTDSPVKATESFLKKCKEMNITLPKHLTVLKDTATHEKTFEALASVGIETDTFIYSDFYWEECISDEIKKYKYNIDVDPYYVEQEIYNFSDFLGTNPIGHTYKVIMNFINNDSHAPIMMMIAQAGAGKTTFIEHLITDIDKIEKLQTIFISSEMLKENLADTHSLTEITSIYQLYQVYYKNSNNQEQFLIDENDFNVGLLNGVIVLIIDGLDEIISLYHENFKLERFINSLIKLNEELGRCKIIITSREYYWKENDILNSDGVLAYRLQGFDEKHLTKYLNKRYERFGIKNVIDKHMSRTRTYLKQAKAISSNNKIIPYVVDILCKAVEDEIEFDLDVLKIEPHNYYSSNQDTIDKIIFSTFEREINRQSYPKGFTVKDLVNIFIDLSVEYGEVCSSKKLIDSIAPKFPETYEKIITSLKFSPLLIVNKESVQLKYDFLENYFVCLHIIQEFENIQSSGCSIKHLSKLHRGESPFFKDIKTYFSNKRQTKFIKGAKNIFNILLKKYKETKVEDKYEKLQIQQSISSILYLLISISGESLPAKEKINLIKELYSQENKIEKLFIFGNFYELDFSDTEIWHSSLNGYKNFANSKFNNTKFFYTEFINMENIELKGQFWEKIKIDETCETYGLVNHFDTAKKQQNMVDKLKNIFQKINNKPYIINKNKQSVVDSMNCLVAFGFVIEQENRGKIAYQLNDAKKRDVKQFLKNGSTSDISISKVLHCLGKVR